VTDQSRSPTHALKIATTTSNLARWLSATGLIRAQAGVTYTASAWVRTQSLSGTVRIAVTFWNASGAYLGVAAESLAHAGTQDWRQVTVQQQAPVGTASIRIELRHTGIGTSWWDDVSLTRPS
jgi:hypothetical protein